MRNSLFLFATIQKGNKFFIVIIRLYDVYWLLRFQLISYRWIEFLSSLKVIIKDKDTTTGEDDLIAATSIPVYEIIKYGEVSGWFQLNKANGKKVKTTAEDGSGVFDGKISMQILYKPKYELAYRHGDGYERHYPKKKKV